MANTVPSDSRAMRRELYAWAISFILGTAGWIALSIWFFFGYAIAREGWTELIGFVCSLLTAPFWGGLVTLVVIELLNRWHHYRGYYACPFCGRPLRRKAPCICLPPEYHVTQERTSWWMPYRQQLRPVVLTMVALLLPAIATAILLKNHNYSLLVNVMILHSLTCLILAILVESCTPLLRFSEKFRSRRRSCEIYARLLVLWPLMMALLMTILTWTRKA